MPFDGKFLAEVGLQALKASHRDADWIARLALDHARDLALRFDDDAERAMALARSACAVRDALTQRIAILEPDVGTLVQQQRSQQAAERQPHEQPAQHH